MPAINLLPELSEDETKKIATRQMLSFLTVSSEEETIDPLLRKSAPSESFFFYSRETLPEDAFADTPTLFNWKSRDIYDVDGRLMLRDHTIDLGAGNEWRVRTAVSESLRTPVWAVKAGRSLNVEGLMAEAIATLNADSEYEAKRVGDEIRLVSHSYPKLGILCNRRDDPDTNFVFDIGEQHKDPKQRAIAINSTEDEDNPESETLVWSPYDIVGSSTIVLFRSIWERDLNFLPELPANVKALPEAIQAARTTVEQKHLIRPELKLFAQEIDRYCGPATAQMIMHHYRVETSQDDLAREMQVGTSGATPASQAAAIAKLSNGTLKPTLDNTASFSTAQDEILNHRPFKTGVPSHARACGGFRVDVTGKIWLYIFNPYPSNQGNIYYEALDANRHSNFMYVRPKGYS